MGFIDSVVETGKKAADKLTAFSGADPQVIAIVKERLSEQDKWNDLFSTKLIELIHYDRVQGQRTLVVDGCDQNTTAPVERLLFDFLNIDRIV